MTVSRLLFLLSFAASGAHAQPAAVQQGFTPDGFKTAADGSDDAPSIQRAAVAACAARGTRVTFAARIYHLHSGVAPPCALTFQGQGWAEPSGGAGQATDALPGTWLSIDATGFTPFTFAAAGTVVESIAVYESAQPTPSGAASMGWTPAAYPYVFNVTNADGEVGFRHVMLMNVTLGIYSYFSQRLHIDDLRAQCFQNCVYVDKAYDTTQIIDVHQWPYWTQNANVLAYQQANLDTIILGRVDDSFCDRIFSLGARSVFKFIRTAADARNPAAMPGGGPTNVVIGAVRGDFVKWSFWNTSASVLIDELALQVSSVIHQGAQWGGLTPIVGNAVVQNDGNFAIWAMGNVKADVLDGAAIVNTLSTGIDT